jgi:uncharacterized coiled-coil protein SlyX
VEKSQGTNPNNQSSSNFQIDGRALRGQLGRMNDGDEKRLVKIESVMAHLEQLTDSLNGTVIEQDKAIRRLSQQVEQLTERASADDMKSAKDNVTKPPHYQ